MENDVFALIFFLSLIWCRYGAAELAPGLPVLAGSSAPGLAAPPGSVPIGWPRSQELRPWTGRASGEGVPPGMAALPGSAALRLAAPPGSTAPGMAAPPGSTALGLAAPPGAPPLGWPLL